MCNVQPVVIADVKKAGASVALDDLMLRPGRCPPNWLPCDFDGGLCSWVRTWDIQEFQVL